MDFIQLHNENGVPMLEPNENGVLPRWEFKINGVPMSQPNRINLRHSMVQNLYRSVNSMEEKSTMIYEGFNVMIGITRPRMKKSSLHC